MMYAIDISDVMFASRMFTAGSIMVLSHVSRDSMFGSGHTVAEAMATGVGAGAGAGVTRLLLA